jgi:glycosyltransferase 2 family protein
MNQSLKRSITVILAVGLLAYVLKDISFVELGQQFSKANYSWIALAFLLAVLTHLARGKRWQQALTALGYQSTTLRTTVAMQSGGIASMIVPGSGELTRCATIQRTDGVPFSHSVGSVVAERVLDLLMLGILLIITFAVELRRMQEYLSALTFVKPGFFWFCLLCSVLVAGFLFYRAWQLPVVQDHSLINKVRVFSRGLGEGFLAIRQLPNPTFFIALTVIIQVSGILSTYLMLLSLEDTKSLPFTSTLTVMAVASISGFAVPTQGGIGTYHFFISRVLTLYGLHPENAVVAATFLHTVGLAINLLLSSISFLIIPFLVTKQPKEPVGES